jgi:predicted NAD/FAD-binding protein
MQRVAIIGTGISGMSAGYFLRKEFDITFYEKEDDTGGHTNTLTINEDGKAIYIDSAFMVYNEPTYPLLTRLFKELNIETKPTSMSFSVQHRPSGLEYCGTGLNGLFAQRRNIFKPWYISMLLEIDRFRHEADEVLDNPYYASWTLSQYMQDKKYSDAFLQKFLIPMSSAVWSTPVDTMMGFPVQSLVRFFKNHRFLSLDSQLAWRTCEGGSRQYRDKIMALFTDRCWTKCAAVQVKREAGKVAVTDSRGRAIIYDKVIMACHANEALSVLADPSTLEASLLSKFPYIINKTTVHTDASVMPKNQNVWSSWNNRIENDTKGKSVTSTIYWMNNLQGVSKKKNYFVSINDPGQINPQKILWEKYYEHPLYTVEGQEAQLRLPELNQNGMLFFCGAYFRYGFHEDGLMSGLGAARAVLGREVWP